MDKESVNLDFERISDPTKATFTFKFLKSKNISFKVTLLKSFRKSLHCLKMLARVLTIENDLWHWWFWISLQGSIVNCHIWNVWCLFHPQKQLYCIIWKNNTIKYNCSEERASKYIFHQYFFTYFMLHSSYRQILCILHFILFLSVVWLPYL